MLRNIKTQLYDQVLSKDMIELEIVTYYLPKPKRGFKSKGPLYEIVNAILYKLKTGIQWEYLPVGSLFSKDILHYKTIFGRYSKWCELDVWKSCWIKLLNTHKTKLDLSSGDLDGSHTTALRGGQEVCYQGRKKRKTPNAIYLTDRQGLPIVMSEPVSGNHNDLFDIEVQFEEVVGTLEEAEISVNGLFISADAGFDSQKLRDKCETKGIIANICPNKRNGNTDTDHCFDEKLYQERYAIEQQMLGWTAFVLY